MFRFSFLSCRLFFFTYAQSFFTTSVRGSGLSPTIFASAGLGCMAFMKAAFGLRALFLAVFFAAAFLAAIRVFLPMGGAALPSKTARTLTEADRLPQGISPSGRSEFALWPLDICSTVFGPRNPQHRRTGSTQQDGESRGSGRHLRQ